jgi:hypothetical protein
LHFVKQYMLHVASRLQLQERREMHQQLAYRTRSVAAQVPETSSRKSDGLYARRRAEQARAAAERVAGRRAEISALLAADGGAPSFVEKDAAAGRAKAARLEAHRKDKNRFQVQTACSSKR